MIRATDTTRRDLLLGLASLGLGGFVPSVFARPRAKTRRLVLIELSGGNDPLNAFPPHKDPLYRRYRPTIAVPDAEIIKLTPQIGWHPSLSPLLPAWEAGEVALLQGVGYPDPILSHFESGRVWETGQRNPAVERGWLAESLHHRSSLPDPSAVIFGFNPGPLRAYTHGVLQLQNLSAPHTAAARDVKTPDTPMMRHLLQVQAQTEGLGRYRAALEKMPALKPDQQKKPLLNTLRCAAAVMSQPDSPLVYKLILGGFDTHAGQVKLQGRQLARLAEGLMYFRELLIQLGLWDQVLIVTYSEFGRRVAENASGGTDHGAAQTQLLMGRGVAPGLHGAVPDLTALDIDGNLRHQIDFRTVYNQVCTHWLGWDAPFASHESSAEYLLSYKM